MRWAHAAVARVQMGSATLRRRNDRFVQRCDALFTHFASLTARARACCTGDLRLGVVVLVCPQLASMRPAAAAIDGRACRSLDLLRLRAAYSTYFTPRRAGRLEHPGRSYGRGRPPGSAPVAPVILARPRRHPDWDGRPRQGRGRDALAVRRGVHILAHPRHLRRAQRAS